MMVRGEVEKQVKQLGPERKNCLCVRSSCTADRTWLPSSSHWVVLFSLVEVGGESINLMEEKGQRLNGFAEAHIIGQASRASRTQLRGPSGNRRKCAERQGDLGQV